MENLETTDLASREGGDRPAPTARLPRLRDVSVRTATLVVLGVALAVRLLYWRLAVPHYEPMSDDAQYLEIATNIAEGRGFSQVFPQLDLHATAFRPPAYPYLLGGLFRIVGGPSVAWGQALNVAIGLGVVFLTVRVGTRVAGNRVGIIAGLLVAVYPPVVANDLVLLTEPLSLLLLLGCLLALLEDRFLVAGLLAGALVLSRPSAQFLVVALVLWVWWQGRRRDVGVLRPMALLVAGTVLVVAPWLVRNHVVLGEATLVTSNGFNAAALYSPQAIETGGFVDPVRDDRFDQFRLAQFDEAVWQRDLQRLAWQNALDHPKIVPQVVSRNLLAYFELRPDFNEEAEYLDGRNPTLRAWTLPLFYVNVLVGAFGLFTLRRSDAGRLLIVIAGYFLLSSIVFVAWPRVRVPFDLILCFGTAAVLARFVPARRPPPTGLPEPADPEPADLTTSP